MYLHIIRTIVYPDEGLIEKVMSNGTTRKSRGSRGGPGYRHTRYNGTTIYMHRLIWEHVNGVIPDGMEIDHINGVRDDNRITNLRLVTRSQNLQNQWFARSDSKSGVKGVSWDSRSRKWTAEINCHRKRYTLGQFTTIEEAQVVYARAATILHTHNPHAIP